MATVLAYTSPAIGHLYPMMPLLLELLERGHEVHVRTIGSHVDQLRELGLIHTEPVDPDIESIVTADWEAKGARAALQLSVRTFGSRARMDGPDLRRAIDHVQPDVVLVDINSWGASLAAEAWGGPWLFFSPYTPPISSRGTPPFGPGLAPRADLIGRVRDAVARPLVLGAAHGAMLPTINALRSDYGSPPVRTADEFFGRAPMLVATAEPFEYPHLDWSDRVTMIGAMPWEPPAPPPAWLVEIDGPLALVSTSSEYQRDEALVRAALEALADEPWTVIATTPAGTIDLGAVPPNARIVHYVPHLPVLVRSVVAVTHGGMGTTQKALAHGVPVCVVPFGRDQLEVAARVVHSRAGTSLPARRLTAASLRDKVRQAVRMRTGAGRVATGLAAAGGAPAGADVVEGLLQPSGVTRL